MVSKNEISNKTEHAARLYKRNISMYICVFVILFSFYNGFILRLYIIRNSIYFLVSALFFLYFFITRKSIKTQYPNITISPTELVISRNNKSTILKKADIEQIVVQGNLCGIALKNPSNYIKDIVESGQYTTPHFIIRFTDYIFFSSKLNSSIKEATSKNKNDNINYLTKLFNLRKETQGYHLKIETGDYSNSRKLREQLDKFSKNIKSKD